MTRSRWTLVLLCLAAISVAAVLPSFGGAAVPNPTLPAERDSEAVVLKGRSFPDWSVTSNTTVKIPFQDLKDCQPSVDEDKLTPDDFNDALSNNTDTCAHNHYTKPEVDTQEHAPQAGTPVDRLLGYRYDKGTKRFVQIPFQVDEVFTRYLDNSASGFAVYSGQDQHTTYAYEREGFRFTEGECEARMPDGDAAEKDPVRGLDSNDELVFMAGDAGPAAPADAKLPIGVQDVRQVRLDDTTSPGKEDAYVYVMKVAADGPEPEFNDKNGYVRYKRDDVAGIFEKSESSYDNYGNARRGTVCDEDGNVIADNERRRPRDYATVTTDRYKWRYDGRWLMTDVRIKDGTGFGPDLVDRWKARAFAQDPGSETPCCGFEEEDTNWGGSSILLGELDGPVRAVRETWGADSGTNVVRRETFYANEMRQKTWLRVHVIPPLDGIYAQWDFNANRMKRFYTPRKPDGVAIDGVNDEVFGNLDDPCNQNYNPENNPNKTSEVDQTYRQLYGTLAFPEGIPFFSDAFGGRSVCDDFPYHQSIDVADPMISDANATTQWSVTAGPHGSIVDRIQIDQVEDVSPGGAAQALVATPYYRDDSCFDDGTGTDPGLKINKRSGNEPRLTADLQPRQCWEAPEEDGLGTDKFFQGSIGTHGLHLLFLVDSDNARQTFPVNEIVSDWRMTMLPYEANAVDGEKYGRAFEKPLVALIALPFKGGGFEEVETPAKSNGNPNGTPRGGGQPPAKGDQKGGSSVTRADDADNSGHNAETKPTTDDVAREKAEQREASRKKKLKAAIKKCKKVEKKKKRKRCVNRARDRFDR